MSTHDVIDGETIGNEPLGQVSAGDPLVVSTVARRGRTPWLRRSLALALVASLAAVVAPLTAGAAPGGDTKESSPGGSWIDAGWASQEDVLNGPVGATGTIELDWQAREDAAVGESFQLRLPSSLEPVDTGDVELADHDGYLGATGTWSQSAGEQGPLLTVELEQEGTVTDDAGDLVLLGGTMAVEVTWAPGSVSSLQAGEQKLMLKGPGFDGADQMELTAVFTDDEGSGETPSPTPSTAGKDKVSGDTSVTAPARVSTGWRDLQWSAAGLSGDAEAVAALEFEWAFTPGAKAGSEVVFELPDELRGLRSNGQDALPSVGLLNTEGEEVGVAQWNDDADALTLVLAEPAPVDTAAGDDSEDGDLSAQGATAPTGTQKIHVGWTEKAAADLEPGEYELGFGGTGAGVLDAELTEGGAAAGVTNALMRRALDFDICENPTMWASTTQEMILEYYVDGSPTGREIELLDTVSNEGYDIAIDSAGEIMWSVSGGGRLDAYSVATGEHLQRFILNSSLLGYLNSLSFSGDTLLYGASGSSAVYAVDLPVPVPGGPEVTLEPYSYLSGGSMVPFGWAGDFITLADGSILGLASNTGIFGIPQGGTRMIMFDHLGDGTFAAPRNVGEATTNVNGKLTTYGGTFVDGSLFFASNTGSWFSLNEIPDGTPTTKFQTTLVSSPSNGFLGATSVQESNAICSSPDISVTKEAGQVSGPDGNGDYLASYTVTVTNDGFAGGTYAALTDTPAFDPNLEVKGASWSGEFTGSESGPGPYRIDTRNVNIAGGSSKTYEVQVRFAYAPGVYEDASSCGAVPAENRGLTNIIGLSGSAELTEDTVACLEAPAAPPAPVAGAVAWNKVAQGSGDLLSGSEWALTPIDDEGSEIIVVDCVAATAAECEGPDTDPEAGRFVVAGLDQGDYELVETKAPAGYVLDGTPRILTVGEGAPVALDIENAQQDGLVIPLTGGMGADRFLLIGGLLAALAAAGVVWRHRRQQGLDGSITE